MKKFRASSRASYSERVIYRLPPTESVKVILQDLVSGLEEIAVPHFGVVDQGFLVRECYGVDFNVHDWETHPIKKCVMLLRQDGEALSTMADVVDRYWKISSRAANNLSLIEGWDC